MQNSRKRQPMTNNIKGNFRRDNQDDQAPFVEGFSVKEAGDLKGRSLQRSFLVQRETINQESRTVQLAFAGETPYLRWYGNEILDCSPSSVRVERLMAKGPLLVGHRSNDQIGVVEAVEIGSDKICRATVRFGRSARAEEIFQDVVDGIRPHVSVGYEVHEAQLESVKDNVETYRIISWEPHEVSIVSMPADFKTAGIGRSTAPEPKPTNQQEKQVMKKCKHCGRDHETEFCGCAAERAALATETRAIEQKRVADIRAAGAQYATRGGVELAAELSADGTATVETFRERMLAKIDAEQKALETTRREGLGGEGRVEVGLIYDKRSLEPFMRGAGSVVKDAERAAFTAGQWARSVLFADANAQRWCQDHNLDLRVMTAASGGAGGFLVPDVLESAIIDLRAEYGMFRRMAEIWPMASGTLTIPVRKSGTTAYFAGDETATTESDAGWGEANLVAKNLSALTRLSNDLVEDAIINLAAKIADEHAYAFAVKEDACGIDGDGTSTYGGITGLKAKLEVSGMKGIYTCATNTDSPQEVTAAELSGLMAKLPSYARKGAVFCTSPAFDELLFARLMAAGGGNTTVTLAGEIMQAYLGKARLVCEPCYSDSTADLTGKAMAFYGNFKQGIAFGERRGITVQVLRERYAEYRQIGVIGTERIDINCHGVGDLTAAGPIVALIGG